MSYQKIEAIHINRSGGVVNYDIIHDLVMDHCDSFETFQNEVIPHINETTVIFDNATKNDKWKNYKRRFANSRAVNPMLKEAIVISSKLNSLSNYNFEALKAIVANTYNMSNETTEKKKQRIRHVESVMQFSRILYMYYCKYPKDKLTKHESDVIAAINACRMSWVVELVAVLHDMFKFSKGGEHGVLAASYLDALCVERRVPTTYTMIQEMRTALAKHSDKNVPRSLQSNLFIKILIDADILSKYCIENMLEKWERYPKGTSFDYAYKDALSIVKKYKPSTPFFESLCRKETKKMEEDIIHMQQENFFEGGK